MNVPRVTYKKQLELIWSLNKHVSRGAGAMWNRKL